MKPVYAILLFCALGCAAPNSVKTAVELSQKVRKALVADKTLSSYAHHVRVTASKGVVILRGPVKSQGEKAAVVEKAVQIAGAGNVMNQLSVMSSRAN